MELNIQSAGQNMKNICLVFFFCCIWEHPLYALTRIGTPNYDPPFVVKNATNVITGYDIDLMKKICKRLNWDCEFVPMRYLNLFPSLQNNTIDFAVGALVIHPQPENPVIYSLPYLTCAAGFLVKTDSKINNVSELQGKAVGAVRGKAYIHYLLGHFPGQMTVIPYDRFSVVALDFYNGKIDAIFMNYLSALYLQHQYPDNIKVLSEQFNVGDGLGIATLPTNRDKIEQINKVLLEFEADGTFADLYNYNFEFFIPSTPKTQ